MWLPPASARRIERRLQPVPWYGVKPANGPIIEAELSGRRPDARSARCVPQAGTLAACRQSSAQRRQISAQRRMISSVYLAHSAAQASQTSAQKPHHRSIEASCGPSPGHSPGRSRRIRGRVEGSAPSSHRRCTGRRIFRRCRRTRSTRRCTPGTFAVPFAEP